VIRIAALLIAVTLAAERITHYTVLRTIEDAYGLRRDGQAASAAPITDIWSSTPPGGATPQTPREGR